MRISQRAEDRYFEHLTGPSERDRGAKADRKVARRNNELTRRVVFSILLKDLGGISCGGEEREIVDTKTVDDILG